MCVACTCMHFGSGAVGGGSGYARVLEGGGCYFNIICCRCPRKSSNLRGNCQLAHKVFSVQASVKVNLTPQLLVVVHSTAKFLFLKQVSYLL